MTRGDHAQARQATRPHDTAPVAVWPATYYSPEPAPSREGDAALDALTQMYGYYAA